MIRLTTTTQTLQAVLGGAVAANQPEALVCFSDHTSTAYSGGRQTTALNSTTDVDIADAPGATTVRDIDYISIYNKDTASVTLTIKYNNNGTDFIICRAVLATLERLEYIHGFGWRVMSAAGAFVTTGVSPVAIADGGTGASTAAGAATALGLGTGDSPQFTAINVGHATDTTVSRASAGDIQVETNIVYRAGGTDVPVTDGGTGRSSHTAFAVICGGTTTTAAQQSIASVGTAAQVLTSNGAGALPTFQAAAGGGFTLGTTQASTSGTALTFTGIPAGTKVIIMSFNAVSLASVDELLIRLGDAGGIETTGYVSRSTRVAGGGSAETTNTTGFDVGQIANVVYLFSGSAVLTLVDAATFLWVCHAVFDDATTQVQMAGGKKALSAELTQIQLTSNDPSTFDAGSINIVYS